MLDDDDHPNTIEGELAVPKRSDGELAFEVAGVEFGLELEQLRNGKVALTVEAEGPIMKMMTTTTPTGRTTMAPTTMDTASSSTPTIVSRTASRSRSPARLT